MAQEDIIVKVLNEEARSGFSFIETMNGHINEALARLVNNIMKSNFLIEKIFCFIVYLIACILQMPIGLICAGRIYKNYKKCKQYGYLGSFKEYQYDVADILMYCTMEDD